MYVSQQNLTPVRIRPVPTLKYQMTWNEYKSDGESIFNEDAYSQVLDQISHAYVNTRLPYYIVVLNLPRCEKKMITLRNCMEPIDSAVFNELFPILCAQVGIIPNNKRYEIKTTMEDHLDMLARVFICLEKSITSQVLSDDYREASVRCLQHLCANTAMLGCDYTMLDDDQFRIQVTELMKIDVPFHYH